jgi:putative IMPACT (imprinted ancient) family translation regulator
MATTKTQDGPKSTIKAYEDKVAAQMKDAKARLDQLEAQGKAKAAQSEAKAIGDLKSAKQDIDRKLQDLKKTHDTHVTRAKAAIDADVAAFKTSVANVADKVKASTAKK